MITIKDIAKEANVSEGTVDRVIHNRGGVAKKTAAKVQQILKHYNFKVNPVASALATKNKYFIVALMPEHNEQDLFWKSPFSGILKAEEDVKNLGIHIKIFTFNQHESNSYLNAYKKALESQPSAVIMVPNFFKETTEITNDLEKLKIPYLFLNIDISGFKNISFVGQDSYTAGYIAGKLMHFNSPKSSEFLIIQFKENIIRNNAVSNRVKGFNDYLIKNKLDSKTHILEIENINNDSARKEIINSYLKNNPKITGIFVPFSKIYLIADCLENQYLDKLELIGFDNTQQNIDCLLNDSVSFLISQKPFEQGYEAVRLLSDYLIKNKISTDKFYLPIDILIKENVKYNIRKDFITS
ncbi:LacI family DNA-binding transcriptional regulator [Polaribacter sargassicola]|uniref:substrate-binding domain-containing protein n=1 Tax=Polaribacter sargassicola TaxID=2836891 RepID=UPI001F2FC10E|nr:LacI family DNA-binding transcriptional regulator [Polaribacter sp. DS7-9]MCG1035204.1 LacI family transcriptional regulator [Polaribacter sp. DS7-9]